MDNWVELLFLVEFSLLIKYYYTKKVQNVGSPNNKALGKATWLKKLKRDPQLKERNKVYLC